MSSQMTTISFQKVDPNFVNTMAKLGSRLTRTPGISVIPEMIHMSVTSAINQLFFVGTITYRFQDFSCSLQSSSFALHSSSSSSDSYSPREYTHWEMGSGDEWRSLCRDDSELLSELIDSEIGVCVVRLVEGDKYLLDTREKSLVHVHSG